MLKSTIFKSALIAACVTLVSSCGEKEPVVLTGNGVTEASWAEVNDVALEGETVMFEFTASDSWTVTSEEAWCKPITTNGGAGLSSLRLQVEANEGQYGRSATVSVQVDGYPETCSLTIRQGEGFIEKGTGTYRDINKWIFSLMNDNYLWNESIPFLTLDYSVDYQSFLLSVLDGVAANGDVNRDDGVWVDGKRQSYHSYISSNAPLTRTVGATYTDSGIMLMATILGPNDDDPCGFAVTWVTPGSPAEARGVKRGDFIRTVNNVPVTTTNYQSLGKNVLNGNVRIDLNDVEFIDGVAKITPREESVFVGSDTYKDPAIYKTLVYTAENGKKIGYLLYMGFNIDYDDSLLEAFDKFKAENIDELVIDLRYNNGGHVLSSTVLGTLVAGQEHSGKVYVRTRYNARRTAAGEVDEYRIGDPANAENGSYATIAEALNSSLGLRNVYVIASNITASASELLINGLRGLDITVNLVGTTTLGKNVGMEGWQNRQGNYQFIFYPVTFYCENAKGFRDYANGFKPELEIDDSTIYPGDFGTSRDILSRAAFMWASTGKMPTYSDAPESRAGLGGIQRLKSSREMMEPLNRRIGGSIINRD